MAYERKYKVTASLQDAYKMYKKDNPDIDKRLYLDVAYDISKTISDMIIRESFEYRIPFKLGFLRIRKKTPKLKIKNGRLDINKNIIDWAATIKYWQEQYPGKTKKELKQIKDKGIIFQSNDHTNGEVMSFYWDRSICSVVNHSIYSFDPVKGGVFDSYYTGRLGLAKWIKSDEKTNDYYL